MTITRRAYAKINYTLSMTGLREDGYHLLDSLMQTVSLYDTLTFEEAEGIELVTTAFPGPQNLAYRAAALLKEETACPRGVRITLTKRIPAGAGLGGGSADAAAVLLALRDLWHLPLSREELLPLAARLGADVPFAVLGGLARCRGVGEILEPMTPITPYPMLLVFPGEGVSTVACYRAYDELGRPFSTESVLPEKGREEAFFAALRNDLEAPALSLMPCLAAVREALEQTSPLACSMSGSGAAYFAIYRDCAARDAALRQLSDTPWQLFPVEPVSCID